MTNIRHYENDEQYCSIEYIGRGQYEMTMKRKDSGRVCGFGILMFDQVDHWLEANKFNRVD